MIEKRSALLRYGKIRKPQVLEESRTAFTKDQEPKAVTA